MERRCKRCRLCKGLRCVVREEGAGGATRRDSSQEALLEGSAQYSSARESPTEMLAALPDGAPVEALDEVSGQRGWARDWVAGGKCQRPTGERGRWTAVV